MRGHSWICLWPTLASHTDLFGLSLLLLLERGLWHRCARHRYSSARLAMTPFPSVRQITTQAAAFWFRSIYEQSTRRECQKKTPPWGDHGEASAEEPSVETTTS